MLYRHPAVLAAAVVAQPDEKWGETPCAFVELKAGRVSVTETELIEYCRAHLARLQGAARGGVRRAAQDLDRQDPEVPAARAGEIGQPRSIHETPMPAQADAVRSCCAKTATASAR